MKHVKYILRATQGNKVKILVLEIDNYYDYQRPEEEDKVTIVVIF